MSESKNVSCYEIESFSKGSWVPDPSNPWCDVNMEPGVARDEMRTPSDEWKWVSNWKIEKEVGGTDRDGWEYA